MSIAEDHCGMSLNRQPPKHRSNCPNRRDQSNLASATARESDGPRVLGQAGAVLRETQAWKKVNANTSEGSATEVKPSDNMEKGRTSKLEDVSQNCFVIVTDAFQFRRKQR